MPELPSERLARHSFTAPHARARRELRAFLGRLLRLILLIQGLVLTAAIGFSLAEHVSLWRGFLLSIDTVATVGSIGEPHTIGGQIVKVALIMLGVGTLFYALVAATEFFVAGHLSGLLQERRMQRQIDSLTDHYLICGFGRVGRQAARDLRTTGARYVVIDDNPESRELLEEVGVRFIHGQPSDDEVLRSAGIERARAILACVDSDAENIFITLTAREMNPEITIVARASAEESESKLRRAGANRVISPYKASGHEMARYALHPQVAGVVDVAPEYRMEELEVTAGSEGEGKTISDILGGAVIVAVRQANGDFQPQPSGHTRLKAGDVLVAMGTTATMERLEILFEPSPAGRG